MKHLHPILILLLLAASCSGRVTAPEELPLLAVPTAGNCCTQAQTAAAIHDTRVEVLHNQLAQLDAGFHGELSVYIRELGGGLTLGYNIVNDRYFASTTKIPIAIAILQLVQQGEISLADELILQESDYVDGNGDILWHPPGTRYTIGTLLEKMIQDSDNCSTDMLVRLIGQQQLNIMVQQMIPQGFNPITTILQVRHDAFSEVHPGALLLTNMQILSVNSIRSAQGRFGRLQQLLGVDTDELQVRTLEEAFTRYYQRGLNSGKPESMGLLLERLYQGELLQPQHTQYLLQVMKNLRTGQRRIRAGLPPGTAFAHKTGTQVGNISNSGIIFFDANQLPIIVVVNATHNDSLREAEDLLKQIGELLTETFFIVKDA